MAGQSIGPALGNSLAAGSVYSSFGFVPATDITKQQGSQLYQQVVEEQAQPEFRDLTAHVKQRWYDAKQSKQIDEDKMIDNLRRRKQQYSPAKLQAIAAAGGGIYSLT